MVLRCRGLSVDRTTVRVMTTDSAISPNDGRHDFDFLHGRWHSRQRKLRKRLAKCQDWDEFTADLHCQPVLGGLGNFDELASPAMTYTGLALRLYDEATRVVHLLDRGRPRRGRPSCRRSLRRRRG